jgi:hypothetical protein
VTYDTGALLAAEAGNRRMWALHRKTLERSHTPTVPAAVLAQAWRGGPQPVLSMFLDGCASEPLDEATARLAGAMLGRSGSADVVDASVVVGAVHRADAIVTSDRRDIEHLADAVSRRADIIAI